LSTFLKEHRLDFDAFLSNFKNKYGEPVEIEKYSNQILDADHFAYRWKDESTLLELYIGYPKKVPFLDNQHFGMIQIRLHDRALKRKYNQDIWNHRFPNVREGLERDRKFIKKDPLPDRMI